MYRETSKDITRVNVIMLKDIYGSAVNSSILRVRVSTVAAYAGPQAAPLIVLQVHAAHPKAVRVYCLL